MTGSPRDQRHYEPRSPEELEAEFQGWHVWRGVNDRWYARLPGTSPPVMLKEGGAVDLAELRNWMIGWTWAHDRERR